MNNSLKRGFVGTEEISLAIAELENSSWRRDENLFINAKMNGKIISCYWYCDLEELLSESEFLEQYFNIADYIGKMKELDEDYIADKEHDCDFEEFSAIFEKNEIAYIVSCGNSGQQYIDNEKEYPIKAMIGSDCDTSFYTYEEAMENLKGDVKYINEDLVIGLLS